MSGKAIHRWELRDVTANGHRRDYYCSRCGAGPVMIGGFDDKKSISRVAKASGISGDCNVEYTKKVLED